MPWWGWLLVCFLIAGFALSLVPWLVFFAVTDIPEHVRVAARKRRKAELRAAVQVARARWHEERTWSALRALLRARWRWWCR